MNRERELTQGRYLVRKTDFYIYRERKYCSLIKYLHMLQRTSCVRAKVLLLRLPLVSLWLLPPSPFVKPTPTLSWMRNLLTGRKKPPKVVADISHDGHVAHSAFCTKFTDWCFMIPKIFPLKLFQICCHEISFID